MGFTSSLFITISIHYFYCDNSNGSSLLGILSSKYSGHNLTWRNFTSLIQLRIPESLDVCKSSTSSKEWVYRSLSLMQWGRCPSFKYPGTLVDRRIFQPTTWGFWGCLNKNMYPARLMLSGLMLSFRSMSSINTSIYISFSWWYALFHSGKWYKSW